MVRFKVRQAFVEDVEWPMSELVDQLPLAELSDSRTLSKSG